MKIQAVLISILLLGGLSAHSEEEVVVSEGSAVVDYDSILDSIVEAVEGQYTEGRIESIDLSGRKAIIGGYEYHFGPVTEPEPLKVKLLGRDFGSLELLSVGMHVEVFYMASPAGGRVGTDLTQIETSQQF